MGNGWGDAGQVGGRYVGPCRGRELLQGVLAVSSGYEKSEAVLSNSASPTFRSLRLSLFTFRYGTAQHRSARRWRIRYH